MSDAEELDESLRAKLRAAAHSDHVSAADHERDARLSAGLLRAAQGERVRSLRTLMLASGLAAAAAAALLLWPKPAREAPRAAAPVVACALPTALSIAPSEEGRQQLVLPGFGELAAAPGSALRVESSDPCRLALFLAHGELAGDLHNLKPAQLVIRTPHGSVVVRGTRFSVRADSELEVVLLSGRVEIQDESPRMLEPRHVFRKAGQTRSVRASEPAQVERIAALLEPHPRVTHVQEPAGVARVESTPERTARSSASELLAQAERERRAGQLARARALYKQASARVHEDDAEVALLRWLRLELESRSFGAAALLLRTHARDFARGKLQAEAAWLAVSLQREQGQSEAARAAARELVQRFPRTPQADAARAYLGAP